MVVQITVTGGHEGTEAINDGLAGLLWSPEVTAIIAKMMTHMQYTVLKNIEFHPEFVGRTFEKGQQSGPLGTC